MKTIERYVFGSFLSSFMLAFLVLTFVLTIGLMVQIVGYILSGLPMRLVGEFTMVSFPETLQWTMPLALLVSSVLVFSRMSADSEIAAMRACGVNLLSVMKWPILFGLACSLIGFYVNNEIVPRGHELRRSLKAKVSVDTGLDVLEPGRVITDFPKLKLYFGAKEGNWVYDLIVIDYSNSKFDRMITASKALVESRGRDIALDLYNMTIDPVDENHPAMARANRAQHVVKDALKKSKYSKKEKDLRLMELIGRIRDDAAQAEKCKGGSNAGNMDRKLVMRNLCELKVELSKRFVFAMASFCFVLVGIPLGIKAQRKESTIGMAIALAVSLGYYLIVILMLSLHKNYSLHPELLIWSAVLACLVLASRLIPRNL